MMATQNQPPAYLPYSNLQATAYELNNDIGHMKQSRRYFVTPQLERKLGDIDVGSNHIRLDHELLNSSTGFRRKFDPAELVRHENNATGTLKRTGNTVCTVKNELANERLTCLYNDELEKKNYDSVQTLNRARMDMGEDVCNSVKRLKQFCDYVGVTDCYTGYRNNLNRGNREPMRLGYSWLGDQMANPADGSKHIGWVPNTTSTAIGGYRYANTSKIRQVSTAPPEGHRSQGSDACERYDQRPVGLATRRFLPDRSIQERCGINMTYPGRTEYMKRYMRPLESANNDYQLNPTPDFSIQGRPLDTYIPTRNTTEYQTGYGWPDACKIVKFPWLRQ